MTINNELTGEKLDHLEVVNEYYAGGFDMNIQDVGVIVQDTNTGQHYDCPGAFFEHGIDEYTVNPKKMEEIDDSEVSKI